MYKSYQNNKINMNYYEMFVENDELISKNIYNFGEEPKIHETELSLNKYFYSIKYELVQKYEGKVPFIIDSGADLSYLSEKSTQIMKFNKYTDCRTS